MAGNAPLLLVAFVAFLAVTCSAQSLGCLDGYGKPVDWWYRLRID